LAQVADSDATDGTGTNEQTAEASGSGVGRVRLFSPTYKPFFSYGAALESIYILSDTAISSQNGQGDVLLAPYASINTVVGRFKILVTSSPTIRYQTLGQTVLRLNGFLDPSFGLGVALGHRFTLDFGGGIDYGNDLTHLYGHNAQACNADCQEAELKPPASPNEVTSPEAAVVRSETGSVFDARVFSLARWQLSRRQELIFRAEHTYISTADISSNNVVSGETEINYGITPVSTLIAYSQVHHFFSDRYDCTSYGAGAGLNQRSSQMTRWGIQAGPEYGSRGCDQRLALAFSGFVRRELSRNMALTFSAGRDQGASYIGGDNWTDSASVALRKRFSSRSWAELEGIYLHSGKDTSSALAYSGYLISPTISLTTNEHVNLVLAYSHLHSTESRFGKAQPGFDRDWMSLVLAWRSARVSF